MTIRIGRYRRVLPYLVFSLLLGALCFVHPVNAQQGSDAESPELQALIADAKELIRSFGKAEPRIINRPTMEAYLELHKLSDRSGVVEHLDLSYGPHELQGLDLFTPKTPPDEALPVVVYLHGGGLVAGDKRVAASDDYVYNNIPIFFARHGVVGINANYRLAPEVSWPAGAEDIHLLLVWIRASISEYGGDPGKVFLMCNSAGCTHAGTYLFSGDHHFEDGPGVAGALLGSGNYTPSNTDYYGKDESTWYAKSVPGLAEKYQGPPVPIQFWTMEYDSFPIEHDGAEMILQLCEKYEDCPEFRQFPEHNHVSGLQSVNTADDAVGMAALEFVHRISSAIDEEE